MYVIVFLDNVLNLTIRRIYIFLINDILKYINIYNISMYKFASFSQ